MDELLTELEAIPTESDFPGALHDLMAEWQAQSVGLDGVEAILGFIEAYPDLDYGTPGALVHFAERFYRHGYEAALLRSFKRRPTSHTAWMIRRVLNGAGDAAERSTYVAALEHAAADPGVDERVREEIRDFL